MENLVYSYTRQDAIEDGIFVDITEVAKKQGFRIPVAVTTNLFDSHIRGDNYDGNQADRITDRNLSHLLHTVREAIETAKNDSMISTNICFEGQTIPTTVWAIMEAQSPTDPSPVLNVMLPSDY